MNNIRHLIFDLDGTLIDSADGIVDAVNYSLRRMNQPEQTSELIRSFVGYPLSKMYPVFTDASIPELLHHFQVRAAETVVPTTVVLDGIDKSIRDLHQAGYRLAIATTKIKHHLEGIVNKFGWAPLFEATVGGDEVDRVKPAPDAFALALERLGAQAENSIVIGDTINDVLAAQALPIKVIGVSSPYGGDDDMVAAKPDYFIDSVAQLPDWLAEHSSQDQKKDRS